MAALRRLLISGRLGIDVAVAISAVRGVGAGAVRSSACFSTVGKLPAPALLETLGGRSGRHTWRTSDGHSLALLQQRQALFTRVTAPPRHLSKNLKSFQVRGSGVLFSPRVSALRWAPAVREFSSGRSGQGGTGPTVGTLIAAARRFGTTLVFPLIVAWKYKVVALSALKLTKFTSLISLGLTTAAYAYAFGIPYGIPFQPMVFIPFMGAYVSHAGTLSAWQSAFVALAGPAAGLAAAVVLYVAAVVVGGDAAPKQGQDKVRGRLGLAARGFRDEDGEGDGGGGGRRVGQLLHALCDFGCMINLFNLLPLGSLDGGQVAATLHPSLLVIGCVFGTAIVYQGEVKNPLIYLILLGGYYQVAARALGWELPRPGMVHLSPRGKAVVAAAYVGIAGALAGLMALNQARLYGPKGEAPGVATGEDSPYAAEFDRLVEELPDI